jgi:hypothetical protein
MLQFIKLLLIITAMTIQDGSEFKEPLAYALEQDQFQNAIKEATESKDYLPVILVTNERVALDLNANMFGEKVIVEKSKEASKDIQNGKPFISVEKVKYKRHKKEYSFMMVYEKIKIYVSVKQKDNQWEIVSFEKRKRKNYSWEF